ncbi:MAG: hypothetical protein AAF497_22290, partial [Planctomycetota bacterium]
HRGMWHSVPSAIMVGLVIYMLCACPDWNVRMLKTCSIVVGYLWHLILDEYYAVESGSGNFRIKRSFGTAFKFFGTNPLANVWTYSKLAAMIAFLMWYQPAQLPHDHGYEHAHGGYGVPGSSGHAAPTGQPTWPWGSAPQTQMTPVPSYPQSSGGAGFGTSPPATGTYPPATGHPSQTLPYYGPGYGPTEYVPPVPQRQPTTTPRHEW